MHKSKLAIKTNYQQTISFYLLGLSFNPFLINVPILHPLKTTENFRFSSVFRGYKIGTLASSLLQAMSICSALDVVTVLQVPLVEQNTNTSFWVLFFSSFAKISQLKPIPHRGKKQGLRLFGENYQSGRSLVTNA